VDPVATPNSPTPKSVSNKETATALEAVVQNAKGKSFVFLLMGRTGVGKSSTVNSLLGVPIAPVGHYEPTTFEVKSYDWELNEVRAEVVDTPGLCDALENRNDQRYLDLIKSNIKHFHLLWYVSRLDDSRVRPDETEALRLITRTFGKDVWKQAIVVFTHAARIKKTRSEETADGTKKTITFEETLKERSERIRHTIATHCGVERADDIPVVAVENDRDDLDGRSDLQGCWGNLYTKVLSRIEGPAAATLIVFRPPQVQKTVISVVPPPKSSPPELKFSEENKTELKMIINAKIIPYSMLVGAAIGAPISAPVAVITAGIAAAIAFLAWVMALPDPPSSN
jgi:predicted GTPase